MSAKRGHVRGAVQPVGGQQIGFSIILITWSDLTVVTVDFNATNPGAMNGRYWYWMSVENGPFLRVATSTGNPLGNVAGLQIAASTHSTVPIFVFVEARTNTGELVGRSAIATHVP